MSGLVVCKSVSIAISIDEQVFDERIASISVVCRDKHTSIKFNADSVADSHCFLPSK